MAFSSLRRFKSSGSRSNRCTTYWPNNSESLFLFSILLICDDAFASGMASGAVGAVVVVDSMRRFCVVSIDVCDPFRFAVV